MKKNIIFLLLVLMLSSCSNNISTKTQLVSETPMSDLIPRETLFGNPDKIHVRISPNGKYLTYIAPKDGVLNIYLADIDNIISAQPITNDKKRGILFYNWAYDNKHIIYSQDNDGDENFAIYSVNIDTKESKRLTSEQSKATLLRKSEKFPEEILIGLNNRKPEYFDIYKLNLRTEKLEKIYENNQYVDFDVDDNFKIRFATKKTPEGGSIIYQLNDKFKSSIFEKISFEDANSTGIVGFDQSGENVYMTDSRNTNTTALVLVNINTKEKHVITHDDKSDISDIIMHPTKKNVQAVITEYERKKWEITDPEIQDDVNYLKNQTLRELGIISRTLSDDIWIVAYFSDNNPIAYYKYDRVNKRSEFLFYHNLKLAKAPLVKMNPIVIKSRDGLDLVSYLTLPKDSIEDEDDTKPIKPVPLVIVVHGGPESRDDWGYDAQHQWLANRGYAALSVNYRGSGGFGKSFVHKGDGEWGGKMHDDILDAAKWAIENDITTKDKVCIMGGSYGGYETLVALTFTPDVFACGIDIVGPSNLITFINSIPPYWKPMKASLIKKIGGIPTTQKGKQFLKSRSPFFFADNIKKPLLIAQGANDPRVKQTESDQIVHKMRSHNIPVTYLLYPDEGHGFVRPENSLAFYAIAEKFLSSYLGGKFEPTPQTDNRSSMEIVYGEEFLPR